MQYFTEPPWNGVGDVRISFYPFAIGIGFLIPLDLLFSCWVFYWFYKIELIVGRAMGWRNLPRFPYPDEPHEFIFEEPRSGMGHL